MLIDQTIEIIRAELVHARDAAVLFDKYRQFYNQRSDVEAALTFLQARIRNAESVVFLAYAGQKPVGFMQLYPTFSSVSLQSTWLLNDLFVHEHHRNLGVGSALLDAAAKFGMQSKARYLMLQTGSKNFTAQRLYESKNWRRDPDLFYVYDLD